MKQIQVTDDFFDRLKEFVVDPFEDTPDTILERLLDIVSKAKRRWDPVTGTISNVEIPDYNEGDNNGEEEHGGFKSRPLSAASAL